MNKSRKILLELKNNNNDITDNFDHLFRLRRHHEIPVISMIHIAEHEDIKKANQLKEQTIL